METHRSVSLLLLLLTIGCSPTSTPQNNPPVSKPTVAASNVSEQHETVTTQESLTPKRFRHPDDRPDLNERRLTEAGIHRLESRRLILLTDRPPESVKHLLPLADAIFDFLTIECGPLNLAADGSDFQVTGCLIDDVKRFYAAQLMPPQNVELNHGRQQGYRFWMRHQADDYYQRHLLLHEFTHCYMHSDQQQPEPPPNWFLEGAAEVFATHQIDRDETRFAVLPEEWTGFEGWGRISEIARHIGPPVSEKFSVRPIPTIQDIQNPQSSLARDDGRYAFWWALCWMLRHHPDSAELWTSLCRSRDSGDLSVILNDARNQSGGRLEQDWLLFADAVCEGFEPNHSFARHRGESATDFQMILDADAGWQDSGWEFGKGDQCRVDCSGECVLATTSIPWVSEPQGITIEWYRGRPIGEVVAVLVDSDGRTISHRVPIGRSRVIQIPRSGRLWLQVNDSESSRHDNSGGYRVSIK